jgi:hypothetical protein
MHRTPDNNNAFAAFVASKSDIDTILVRLTTLERRAFQSAPEDITWATSGPWAAIWKDCARSPTPLSTRANT